MSPDHEDLLERAMGLPPAARAALADALLNSLEEGGSDPDAEQAWFQEIAKRVEEVRDGVARTIPWAAARRRLFEG